ncbi:hypothetical protein [Burkholderia sp. S171]|uniref:hypothetical protein n=1 Tax=Burkholderia sp. S171 TaxID=1641860 RepID=UPI00131ECF8A|nr:hypothetical protein [Burkholderia sp. S171]
MLEFTTAFVCIGGNDPPGRFNRCRLPLHTDIADRIDNPSETFNLCEYNRCATISTRAYPFNQHFHAGPVEGPQQFAIEPIFTHSPTLWHYLFNGVFRRIFMPLSIARLT